MDKKKKIKAIIDLLKRNPDQIFSANKVNNSLDFPQDNDQLWETRDILLELKKHGSLQEIPGHGFKYIAFEDRKVG